MRKINPEYVSIVSKATSASPYFKLLNMRLIDFDIGSCKIEIIIDPKKHFQPFGNIHGGVYASIIDAAAFWAVYGQVDENIGMTSIDLKLNYLSATNGLKLIAHGKKIKLGRTLGYGQVQVTDETGKILAHGTSTLMIVPDLNFKFDEPLPPKFL
ncbi:MAG: PaaI family thioesterase [Syntrophaceae bacterium]|nr:PaaI family thioesterase [Syntrophaceae bacterium]